jgi:hypothetical protein
MSTLKSIEKQQLERLFGMGSGYVLDFSNRTLHDFIRENADIDIYLGKYAVNGDSKANRLRTFWNIEPDPVVGKVLAELIEYWCYLNPHPNQSDTDTLTNCTCIVERMIGQPLTAQDTEALFLERDFKSAPLRSAVANPTLLPIMESRLEEATWCLAAGAPLASIFMCGSLLEGLLLGAACSKPKEFNQAPNSPQPNDKVKPFPEWRLAELIDAAFEVGCLTLDVKKFSHVLRDFRNYIHPYQQMSHISARTSIRHGYAYKCSGQR